MQKMPLRFNFDRIVEQLFYFNIRCPVPHWSLYINLDLREKARPYFPVNRQTQSVADSAEMITYRAYYADNTFGAFNPEIP